MRISASSAILFLTTVAVFLLTAEGLIRVRNWSQTNYHVEMWRYARLLKQPSENPILGHVHVRPSEAFLQKVKIRINSKGLRGGPVAPIRPGQRRILLLGSSIALGWGVDEQDTVAAQLETRLRADSEDVVVFNGGIGNYNAVRYVERYLTMLSDLEPTDIVLLYFINDAEQLESRAGNFLLRNSQLAVTLWIARNRIRGPSGKGDLIEHYRQIYAPDATGHTAMLSAMNRLSVAAAASGTRVYLAVVPDVHDLANYPFGFVHQRMAQVASQFGFTFVDLLPALDGLGPEDIWALPTDPHPNGLGHRRMAQALYPVLRERSRSPQRPPFRAVGGGDRGSPTAAP
ncbi:MAG: SGNH/GDSL hydrolase family protein [Alphaproteobacteria bacterium]|nr:SGNH/GDSL hydrolase family protein [Alphaproteobacteria bacterium]